MTPEAVKALAEALREPLAQAMQEFQDKTFLLESSHRYHCGGSEADRLVPYLAPLLAARGWTLEPSGLREALDEIVTLGVRRRMGLRPDHLSCEDAAREMERIARAALSTTAAPRGHSPTRGSDASWPEDPTPPTPTAAGLDFSEWASWIVRQGRMPDGACPECGPVSPYIEEMQCVPHEALAYLKARDDAAQAALARSGQEEPK